MKLSELIKQLQEIQKEYKYHKVDVMIVNNYLIIRDIIDDHVDSYRGAFIEAIDIE